MEPPVKTQQMSKRNVYVAVDFECPGGTPSKHGFTKLGACIVNADTNEKIASFF